MPANRTPALTAGDRHALKMFVSRLHVGASNRQVIREVRERIARSAKPLRKKAYRYALKYHADNRNQFRAITAGFL